MKIFVLVSRFPYPLEKGDKLRAYNQIKQLSVNHEIHLCALNDLYLKSQYFEALRPYCKSIHILNFSKITVAWNIILAAFKGKPLQVGYFYNRSTQRKVDNLIAEIKPDRIYCQLLRVAEYVRKNLIPKTIDYQDVFSKGVERRIKTAPFYFKPLLRFEYKRLCKYENEIFDDFENKTIISLPDRELIPHPDRGKIVVIPNGVDTVYFKPFETKKNFDLIFTGNMGYPPNVNAAVFLAKEVLPLVQKELPEIRLVLAGASPHPRVLELKKEKIEVTGWVEDIRNYYAGAKIFIAPMLIGTGLQNKLLEAMAMKIPCITSPLANGALGAKNGEDILVGESSEEFAGLIIDLLTHPQKAKAIAEKGYQFVLNNYNWESTTAKLEEVIIKN
jgi:polysaccharide biosynthesis protein PslH